MSIKRLKELKGGVSNLDNSVDWKNLRDESVKEMIKLKPLTKNQEVYIKAIENSVVTICTSCAGTGKTAVACGIGAEWLREGKIKKIVITRPLVSCGKGMGWLPGTMEEKVGPFMRPILDAFSDFAKPHEIEQWVNNNLIEVIPLEFMRGLTLKNAFIICDEAQNAEFSQLHMILTRIGKNSKLVITGDISLSQTDLIHNNLNPLCEVIRKIRKKGFNKDVTLVEMTRDDIVRHHIVQWLDEALTEETKEKWFKTICPNCLKINYDNDDYAESIKCWNCQRIFTSEENPTLLKETKFDSLGCEKEVC